MNTKEISRIDKGIEKIAAIAILAVVGAVLLGFVRLALDHWGYLVLLGLGAGAGYYIYTQSK